MLIHVLIGAVTSALCAVLLRSWARRRRIVKKVGTPLTKQDRSLPPVGGLALAAGLAAGVVSAHARGALAVTDPLIAFLASAALLLAVGLIDDFVHELSPWQKLLMQVLAWLVLLRGGVVTHIVMLPAWANLLLSLGWTLTIINALNLLDIADGLAVSIGLIASGTLLFVSLQVGQVGIAILLAVLCGALLGVLVFNAPRATLFLGDSGSMVVGLALAALSIAISYAPLGREMALLTPLIVLGVPLYDLAFVAIVRMRNGHPVLKKSRDHFIFRLIRQGLSPTQAVQAMLGLCLAFSAAAVVVSRASNFIGAVTLGGVLVFACWWAVRMARVPMHD